MQVVFFNKLRNRSSCDAHSVSIKFGTKVGNFIMCRYANFRYARIDVPRYTHPGTAICASIICTFENLPILAAT